MCRTFEIRYKEHIQVIRNNNGNSGFSNLVLNTGHAYGNTTDTMRVIKTEKKGKHVNTLEKYHILIYKMGKDGLHMNHTYINVYNLIFKVIQELNTRWRHIHIIKGRTSWTWQAFENDTHSIIQQEGTQPTTLSKYTNK
jgi:hypothetical protein